MAITRPPARPLTNRRGAALLLMVYTLALTLLTLGNTGLLRALTETRAAQLSRDQQQAFWLAEAALDQALAAVGTSGLPAFAVSTCGDPVTASLPLAMSQPTYRLCRENEQLYRIEATGTTGNVTRRLHLRVSLPTLQFQHVAYVTNALLFGNSETGGMDTQVSTVPANITFKGDLATAKSTLTNAWWLGAGGPPIVVGGLMRGFPESVIQGDIYVGPGGDPNQLAMLTPGTIFTGQKKNLSTTPTLPLVEVPSSAVDLGNLSLGRGQKRCLDPGVYKVGSLWMDGRMSAPDDTVLCTTGPVDLYVTGPVWFHGGKIYGQPTGSAPYANQYSPGDLRILYVQSGPESDARGAELLFGNEGGVMGGPTPALLAGVVYAPKSRISVRAQFQFIGALVARNLAVYPFPLSGEPLSFGQSWLFYDESLRSKVFQVGPQKPQAVLWSSSEE